MPRPLAKDVVTQAAIFEVYRLMKRESCADNPRVARVGNLRELRTYVKAMRRGCCGYYDRKHLIGTEWFWLGFNYGH